MVLEVTLEMIDSDEIVINRYALPMSATIVVAFVDVASFSLEVDRVCWVLVRSFPERNWCGPPPSVWTVGGQSVISENSA
jgi:hypothetical protein